MSTATTFTFPQRGRDKELSEEHSGVDSGFDWEGPTLADLPFGLSKSPFCWQFFDKTFDMEFLGGFVGVAQDQETLTLRPEIGWAVREAPPAE